MECLLNFGAKGVENRNSGVLFLYDNSTCLMGLLREVNELMNVKHKYSAWCVVNTEGVLGVVVNTKTILQEIFT